MEPVPANLSDAELESRRASVRRGLQRLQTAAALVLVLVIVLATAALLQAWRAERKSGEATRASRQAELELWHSRLLQAQSGRGSGRVGGDRRVGRPSRRRRPGNPRWNCGTRRWG